MVTSLKMMYKTSVFLCATLDQANFMASHSRISDTRITFTDTNYDLKYRHGLWWIELFCVGGGKE